MSHRLLPVQKRRRFGSSPWAATLAATALFALGAAQASAAGRVFFDDFESGNTSKWGSDGSRTKCTPVRSSVDGTAVKNGSFMLECNWNGAVAWDNVNSVTTLSLSSFSYSKEFLLRFWVRYASDVDRAAGNKLLKIASASGNSDFILNGAAESSGGQMVSFFPMLAGAQGPTFWGDGSGFADGKWHEVEIYVKHNSDGQSDGAFKVWQDGKAKQTLTNIRTVTGNDKWYPLYLMSNWSSNPGWEHDAANHAYWDDVEIYSDTASGASGSMSDGSISASGSPQTPVTTPAPPSGVQIQ
jgi:hypothetical protein